MTSNKSGSAGATHYRHWHHYRQGKVVERVVRIDPTGHAISIMKATEPSGLIEFTVAAGLPPQAPFEDFEAGEFGSARCSPQRFESLQLESSAFIGRYLG